MRMDDRQTLDAAAVVNTYPIEDLARLIAEYSDERYAGRVARAIERDRPITSTKRLAEVVRDAIPVPARREGGHPARRTFQAIRLEVNQELPVLTTALGAALDHLLPGGRCVVLSYHSGEDRIAKDLFRSWSVPPRQPAGLPVEPEAPPARLVHRGVVVPSAEEQAANPTLPVAPRPPSPRDHHGTEGRPMTALARTRSSHRSGPARRHLGLVREDGVPALSALAGTVAGVGVVFIVAALFGLAIAHTMLAQGEDRLVEMDARLDVAAERNRELSADVAALEAPERVEREAEGRLGMVRPERVQWLVEIDPHTELDAGHLDDLAIEPGAPSS